ncbi:MAG TPA: tetratricopeptide repeat protein [Nevskiales bacterium]|nr:tetratricopeptide repeat protein [Nevskiales bacterium]
MRWLPTLLCLLPVLAAAGPAADCHLAQEHYAAGEYERALEHWRVLAEDGHAHSQLMIGALYFNGQGVERDPAEAARWFRRAADSGSADAALQLAQMYGSGDGLPQDAAEAQRWRVRAAELATQDGIKCHEAKHRGVPAHH